MCLIIPSVLVLEQTVGAKFHKKTPS